MRSTLFTLATLMVCVFTLDAQAQQCPQEFVDACNLSAIKLEQTKKALKASEEARTALKAQLAAERLLREAHDRAYAAEMKIARDRIKQLVDIKCQETEVAFKPLGFTIFRWKKKRCFE